jgi:hypothetical protein
VGFTGVVLGVRPTRSSGQAEEFKNIITVFRKRNGNGSVRGYLATSPPLHELAPWYIEERQELQKLVNSFQGDAVAPHLWRKPFIMLILSRLYGRELQSNLDLLKGILEAEG